MLAKRLAAGVALAAAVALMLAIDSRLAPYFPAQLLVTALAGSFAALELVRLLPPESRPPTRLTVASVVAVLAANWVGPGLGLDPWRPVALVFAGGVLAMFVRELTTYDGRGQSGSRAGGFAFALCYLGLLPSFLLQICWLDAPGRTALMLIATVIAAKGCDIGAYAVGRMVGRTPLAPILSPNKTREGFAGGVLFASFGVTLLELITPLFRFGLIEAALFGAAVGVAGVFGDLAESMLKRDARAKNAGERIPGFGGVLDVFDSLIFAGPVAYVWFAWAG